MRKYNKSVRGQAKWNTKFEEAVSVHITVKCICTEAASQIYMVMSVEYVFSGIFTVSLVVFLIFDFNERVVITTKGVAFASKLGNISYFFEWKYIRHLDRLNTNEIVFEIEHSNNKYIKKCKVDNRYNKELDWLKI